MAELAIIVDSNISFVLVLHNGHPFFFACLLANNLAWEMQPAVL
jgi:hypothetical protein